MKIKRYYLLVAFLSASLGAAFAQDSTKTQYIFKGGVGKIKTVGLYVAPEFHLGSLAGTFTPLAGGSAMLLLNKKFGIGIAGYSTLRNFTPSKLNGLQLNSHFGGVKFEYTPNPNKVVHLTYSILGGVGTANVDSANNGGNFGKGRGFGDRDGFGMFERGGLRGNYFGVIEPSIRLEANLFRYAKLFGGVSYRITTGGSNIPSQLTNSDLSGVNFSLGLKMGFFDLPIRHGRKHKNS